MYTRHERSQSQQKHCAAQNASHHTRSCCFGSNSHNTITSIIPTIITVSLLLFSSPFRGTLSSCFHLVSLVNYRYSVFSHETRINFQTDVFLSVPLCKRERFVETRIKYSLLSTLLLNPSPLSFKREYFAAKICGSI